MSQTRHSAGSIALSLHVLWLTPCKIPEVDQHESFQEWRGSLGTTREEQDGCNLVKALVVICIPPSLVDNPVEAIPQLCAPCFPSFFTPPCMLVAIGGRLL